jgi:hypothetical protein
MKYILMMNTMKAGEGVPGWPKKDLQALVALMMNFVRHLRESGGLVSAEGLSFPGLLLDSDHQLRSQSVNILYSLRSSCTLI